MRKKLSFLLVVTLVFLLQIGCGIAAASNSPQQDGSSTDDGNKEAPIFATSIRGTLNRDNIKEDFVIKAIPGHDLKEQLILELQKAHKEGKFKDVTEDMILSMNASELRALLANQYLSTQDLNKEVKDYRHGNDNPDHELAPAIDYDDLYSYPEDTQKSIFGAIKDYAKEKQDILALLAVGGAGGLVMLKTGKVLLENESEADRTARHIELEKDLFDAGMEAKTYGSFANMYKETIASNFSDADNMRNLTEFSINNGMTLQQEKAIATNIQNAAVETIGLIDDEYQAYKAPYENSGKAEKEIKKNFLEELAENSKFGYPDGYASDTEINAWDEAKEHKHDAPKYSHSVEERLRSNEEIIKKVLD